MQVFPLSADYCQLQNYIWIIQVDGKLICVDPTEAKKVIDLVKKLGKTLDEIWITHGHYDHIRGIPELLNHFPKVQIKGSPLIALVTHSFGDGQTFSLAGHEVEVRKTEGHKKDHMIFLIKSNPYQVFCGDLLFSAGCGRVLDGTMRELFDSIHRLNQLPEETLLYPAHEYTRRNLEFARGIEPHNEAIKETLAQIDTQTITLPTTLAHEREVNPFLRIEIPEVKRRVLELSPSTDSSAFGVFSALRSLRDRF
ncbi:MAG: hydroxyacylglutathione hydrolase [Neisseriaceae bacterium]